MFSANITITIASPMISVIVSGIIREIAAASAKSLKNNPIPDFCKNVPNKMTKG